MIFDAIGKPDHVYDRINNQVNRLWWSKCPQHKHLLNVNKRKQGNGKPKGIWAGTFTMSPSDPYNEEDMVKAVRKLFSQNTSPVKKYSWYVERTENDLPHIHFCYQTPDGGRILAKVFKRVWPIWDENHSVGRGHRGGYHSLCASPDDYLKYISKDKGRHDTQWPEDDQSRFQLEYNIPVWYNQDMPRNYARRRKSVRPFRAMRKARMYRSAGLAAFGRRVGRFVGRKVSNQVHTFRKMIALDDITENGNDRHLSYQFNLDQLADETDFQALYDSYKIKKIILHLEPMVNSTNTNGVAPYQKWMRIVHDYDDISPLTSESQYLEYGSVKSRKITSGSAINIPLYPKIQTFVQAQGGTVQAPITSGWLPTTSDGVWHLGLKIFVPTLQMSVGNTIFRVRATFIFQCKNSK